MLNDGVSAMSSKARMKFEKDGRRGRRFNCCRKFWPFGQLKFLLAASAKVFISPFMCPTVMRQWCLACMNPNTCRRQQCRG